VPTRPPLSWQEVRLPAGCQLPLKAARGGKWLLIDGECELIACGPGVWMFSATKPGRYRVVGLCRGTAPQTVVVVVEPLVEKP
jgi:hypothetical protein